ncbi:MAG: phosphotransferase [Prolixibacteraceae bacterium]|nr:phosphotransferase [Prolixibacteraceae bacterium]
MLDPNLKCVKNLLTKKYALNDPKIKKLVGYDIVNYKVETDSEKYILKVYPDIKEEIDLAVAENKVLIHLQKNKNNNFPKPVKNSDDKLLTPFKENNTRKTARLLNYLEGEFLGDAKHSVELFKSFGKFLADMDLQLKDFRNYVIGARQFKWDLNYFLLNEKYIQYISNPSDRKIVAYFFRQFKENVAPVLPTLRKQTIHGDANEWNTLTQNNHISGIIDFGDVCYAQLINEPAIALAYSLLGKNEPVKWAIPIISEYHKILPLEEKEIDILYWLIAARLCTSACNSAYERIQRPENSYIQISEKNIWEMLRKWITINPVFVRNEFRKATGFKIPKEKEIDKVKTARFK